MFKVFLASENKLGIFSLVMMNVIAVNSLRSLPISAEYGCSLIAFYIFASISFLIPVALVAAELSTGWPQEGGPYIWIKFAFGKNLAFLAIWLQWIYNLVWYPTILSFIVAALAYVLDPSLIYNKHYMIGSILLIFWLTTLINCFGINVSSLFSILGAIVGTLIPILFIVLLALIWIIKGKAINIDFSIDKLLPNLTNNENLGFLSALFFGLAGMEMSAVHAEDVANPQRNYPIALFYSTIVIFLTMVLGSLSIAMVVPLKQLNLITGVLDAFKIFLNYFNLGWALPFIAFCIIIGGICCILTWSLGPTRSLLIAAQDGLIPLSFMYINRFRAPVVILLIQSLIFTVICSVFIFSKSINSAYWILSALTSQLALLYYIILFLSAIKLRYKYPEQPRAYRLPGSNICMWLIAGIGIFACFAAICLGFIPPKNIQVIPSFSYTTSITVGMLIVLIFGILNRMILFKIGNGFKKLNYKFLSKNKKNRPFV